MARPLAFAKVTAIGDAVVPTLMMTVNVMRGQIPVLAVMPLLAACTVAGACSHRTRVQAGAQRPPSSRPAPPRPARVLVDTRTPLDRTRSAFIDDQSNASGTANTVRNKLRAAHLWKLMDRPTDADLIVTLSRPRTATRPGQRPSTVRPAYELTVRSARSTVSTPLWRGTAASPETLVGRLKADVAPSACVILWCW